MQSFACTVTTDHLRFHFVATNPGNPGEVFFVVCSHLYILQSAARFYRRHVTWGQPAKHNIPRPQPTRWLSLALTSSRVHTLWFLACVLTAAPGVVYSAVKAVGQTEALHPAHESMSEQQW
eukprot:5100456-Amphidinium_carterae.1